MTASRVGMLVHGYYPIDPRVRREAEGLASAGYEVHVVCLRGKGVVKEPWAETVKGVRIHRLPITRRRGGQFRYLFEYTALLLLGSIKLAQLHLSKRFQVVHIHNMPDLLVLAGLLPKWTGAKLILDVHDPMVELYHDTRASRPSWMLKLLGWQEKFGCRMATKVLSVSESMRENLERKGVPSEKIFIVHNFPDNHNFPNGKNLEIWPRHKDRVELLYCGTITDHYRLDVAIRALPLAVKEVPNLRLRVVGDGNRIGSLRELAHSLGLADQVEFSGPVSGDKVRHIMASADVGISTHQAGVFGDLYFSNKILEYLSQGLPVVSSRTETMLRYLPEDTIFYFEPGDPADMAKQLVRALKNPALALQKVANGRKLLAQYTWENENERLSEFYHDLVATAA